MREQNGHVGIHGDPFRRAEILSRSFFDLPFPNTRDTLGDAYAEVSEGPVDAVFMGRTHLRVGMATAFYPVFPVKRAFEPVGMGRRRAYESDAAGAHPLYGSQVGDQPGSVVRAVCHPAGAVGRIGCEFRHEVFCPLAPFVQRVGDGLGLSCGRGGQGLDSDQLPGLLYRGERSDAVHVNLYFPDGPVVVEFQFVDVDLAVGAVPAEFQVGQVIVVRARHVEDASVAGAEHAGFRVRLAHQVLFRDFVRSQRGDPAHLVIVAVALERHEGIEVVIDSLAFEEDRPFGVHGRMGRDVDVVRERDHVFSEPGEVALAPDHVALPVVIDEGLGIDRHLAVFPVQTVLRGECISFHQAERSVRTVGHGRVHVAVDGRVGVPFPLVLHRLAGRPVFLMLRLWEIGPLEAPVHEIPGFPNDGRAGSFQSLSIAIRGNVAVECTVVDNDARVSGHVRNQRVAERVVRYGMVVREMPLTEQRQD